MEPLIELIRQIDGADIPTIMEICCKLYILTEVAPRSLHQKRIDKLYIYIHKSYTYEKECSFNLLVVYENKILNLFCDNSHYEYEWYSTDDDTIEEMINSCGFYVRGYESRLIEYKDMNTDWLFATKPCKSARNN